MVEFYKIEKKSSQVFSKQTKVHRRATPPDLYQAMLRSEDHATLQKNRFGQVASRGGLGGRQNARARLRKLGHTFELRGRLARTRVDDARRNKR